MKRTPWLSELEAQESLWGLLSVERLLDLEKKLDRADRRMILEMVAAALIGALCSAELMWESARMLIQALAPRSSAGWWALALTAIWLWMSVESALESGPKKIPIQWVAIWPWWGWARLPMWLAFRWVGSAKRKKQEAMLSKARSRLGRELRDRKEERAAWEQKEQLEKESLAGGSPKKKAARQRI